MTVSLYDNNVHIREYYTYKTRRQNDILSIAERHNVKRDCDHFKGKKSDLYEFLIELDTIYYISIR